MDIEDKKKYNMPTKNKITNNKSSNQDVLIPKKDYILPPNFDDILNKTITTGIVLLEVNAKKLPIVDYILPANIDNILNNINKFNSNNNSTVKINKYFTMSNDE